MTDKVENTDTRGVIGVVISGGEVIQVSVNDPALEGLSVVIIEDDCANNLMRTGLDEQITTYMEAAREKNAKAGTALVSELTGAHLIEISKASYSSSQEMAQAMADALDHAVFLLGKARSGDLPADEAEAPTAATEAPQEIPQIPQIPQVAQVAPLEVVAPEIAEQPTDQMPQKAADGQRATRLYPSW